MIPSTGERNFKPCFHGRLTREGKRRRRLQQGGVLSCRRRLGGGERREAAAAISTFMELVRSLRKSHVGHRRVFGGCKKDDVSPDLGRAVGGRF